MFLHHTAAEGIVTHPTGAVRREGALNDHEKPLYQSSRISSMGRILTRFAKIGLELLGGSSFVRVR
jgi:hypothetical protein